MTVFLFCGCVKISSFTHVIFSGRNFLFCRNWALVQCISAATPKGSSVANRGGGGRDVLRQPLNYDILTNLFMHKPFRKVGGGG